ncbi:MAG: hypothetical protein NVS9B12_14140 [Vulcanimicrobiaceae bacterium]
MNVRRWTFPAAVVLCIGVAACGAGGGGGSTPAVTPPLSTATTITIAGGKITLALPGDGTMEVIVPANAVLQPTPFTVSVYSSAASLPKPFLSAGRSVQSVPSGATFLAGFSVDTGGAPLYRPLQVTETSATAPATGLLLRLAMFNAALGSYTDIDSARANVKTLSNNLDKNYVGVSSAGEPYAFYAIAGTNAATPAPISFSVTPAGPYPESSSIKITALAADANGNPYAFIPDMSADSNLGVFTPGAFAPFSASLVTAPNNATGSIKIADASRGTTAKVQVSVAAHRPIANGNAYAYSGTLSQTFVRSLPVPQPPSLSTAVISQAVTVTSARTFKGQGDLYDFNTV